MQISRLPESERTSVRGRSRRPGRAVHGEIIFLAGTAGAGHACDLATAPGQRARLRRNSAGFAARNQATSGVHNIGPVGETGILARSGSAVRWQNRAHRQSGNRAAVDREAQAGPAMAGAYSCGFPSNSSRTSDPVCRMGHGRASPLVEACRILSRPFLPRLRHCLRIFACSRAGVAHW